MAIVKPASCGDRSPVPEADPSDQPSRVLKTIFGLSGFRGEQQAIIEHVVAGGDAIVLMPTGGGKSLCYQIPAICRDGVGIVVSPLIALMRNQVDILRQLGVRVATLNSSLTGGERQKAKTALRDGKLDLLYVAPERLMMPDFLEMLDGARIALIAIDEAHCVSQWGHDFRPEYLQIADLAARFPGVPRIALTATADRQTREDIRRRLKLDNARRFLASFDRPNIRYAVMPKTEPRRQLMSFLKTRQGESGIVYCLSRKSVDESAAGLQASGIRALAYHAGLDAGIRSRHQDAFLKEEGLILVATIAFGMGIDKPDVRFVAHLDLPGSLEAYYQETGRAGRDGLPAETLLLYGMQDLVLRRSMIDQSQAPPEIKRIERAKLDALLGVCETSSCRRQALLAHFGEARAEPCGNCDTCLAPVETWDGLIAAQKAMSAARRTGERFGVGHLIDILLGANTDKIRRFRHERLPTFGVGKEFSRQVWGSVFRQLIVQGALSVDHDHFGALKLTPRGEQILRGREGISFRRDHATRTAAATVAKTSERIDLGKNDAQLFAMLKAERAYLAKTQNLPGYVIFHDETLVAIAKARPHSLVELATIPGMGTTKIERYGMNVIDVIAAFEQPDHPDDGMDD
ncbi:DNA helicase RecQ [Acidiphilium acidophilum]|uniref:DNA helicase RecQ n=1 Tax=Acidiphilium acidophilum TaxID=76588 RepID=UPI002E8E79F8|nr:DNA helicase RecQ [Acidiphilium acidophilum]